MSIVDDFSEIAKNIAKLEAEKKGDVVVEEMVVEPTQFFYPMVDLTLLQHHQQTLKRLFEGGLYGATKITNV
jgi:hypothetical protein